MEEIYNTNNISMANPESGTESIKKRKQLTLSEKLDFLDKIEKGGKVTKLAREFGISSSTASGIYKDRSKIKLLHEHYKLNPTRKRMRLSLYNDVDEAVYMWYGQMRSKNTPVNGPMLQQKAREFGKQLGHKNFEGSSGWLYRFRERHDMSVESMRGDNNSDSAITTIGMTDDEIVSYISQNTQSEYIASHLIPDCPSIKEESIEPDMPVCIEYSNKQNISDSSGSNNINNQNFSFCDSTDDVTETEISNDDSVSTIKLSDAIGLMKHLNAFFEVQSDIPKHIWDSLNNVNNFLLGDLRERLKQRRITDYFK